ncbi:hypothetical protein F441_09030 [Phytophthora nicotianae CJ01A1]|uniref:SWIM-type domain-containing protein n=1 Tax=Phytophthora nicotianae CJ01A1 TaxID=1317063 RepID=W2X1D3_PHYNI|nr:hypothetical protein F441_09030 [Phytophthora nicotianae CJ01A1]
MRNWDSCQDMWVMHLRAKLPHYKNHTNNRLENFFGKLKEVINSSMSLAQCVEALVAADRCAEKEYEYKLSRIGRFVNSNYDEEMGNVLRSTTHFVAEQIEPQYAAALSKAATYSYEAHKNNSDEVLVLGTFSCHVLNTNDWRCDCEFSKSMRLPCRHAIAYRRHIQFAGPMIPWSCIDERWTSPVTKLKVVWQLQYENFQSDIRENQRKKRRTQADRYKEAVRATHLIASELADLSDDQDFEDMLQYVLEQWRHVRQKVKLPLQGTELKRESEEVSEDSTESQTLNIEKKDTREAGLRVRINPKARKVGRPQKHRKTTAASERADRKWYKAAESGRALAGADTLEELWYSLSRDQPGLQETERRLSGVLTKYHQTTDKKPLFRKMRNPVLVLDPFYILPSKLLDHCMKVLPVGNTLHQAVCVDTGSSGDDGPTAVMEVIQIKDVGSFSRPQIQLMKKIDCLKAIVQQGINTHKWILEEGLSALPAQYHYLAKQVADEVMNNYPYKNINGLSGSNELVYSMLYRAVPPAWLSDACIRGLAIRLVADNPSARFAGFQTVTTRTSRARAVGESLVSSDVLARLIHQIAEMGMETALLALTFHNAHWCCIVVKVTDKRIFYYDPLNQKPYMRAAKEVATYLKHNGLAEYDVVPQNKPVQFDQMSCGVFVCWMFMHSSSSTIS